MAKPRKSSSPKARKQTRKSDVRQERNSSAMLLREDPPMYRLNGDDVDQNPQLDPAKPLHTINSMAKVTGYAIYNEDAKKRTKQNGMPTLYPDFPKKKFDIIYADPPWDYNGKLQFDKTSIGVEEIDLSRKIFISSACFKYPTLKLDELVKMPVREIAKDDCLLFMWTTNPHLEQSITLGKGWGFEYRTVAFIWDKMNHNPGKYTLSNREPCLYSNERN